MPPDAPEPLDVPLPGPDVLDGDDPVVEPDPPEPGLGVVWPGVPPGTGVLVVSPLPP